MASKSKCTQVLAKRSSKLTQVFNLRQPASPFGQVFKWEELKQTFFYRMEEDVEME